jgi:hypothetical protein
LSPSPTRSYLFYYSFFFFPVLDVTPCLGINYPPSTRTSTTKTAASTGTSTTTYCCYHRQIAGSVVYLYGNLCLTTEFIVGSNYGGFISPVLIVELSLFLVTLLSTITYRNALHLNKANDKHNVTQLDIQGKDGNLKGINYMLQGRRFAYCEKYNFPTIEQCICHNHITK